MLIIGTIISAILAIAFFALKHLRIKILPVLLFSILTAFTSGVLFGLQGNENNNRGFLANVIPGLESVQNSLGIISKDVSDIKETTSAIKEDTQSIKTTTQSIDNKMDDMIDKVGKQGGIIVDPQTPEENYPNARVYEINGDYGNARRSYLQYFKSEGHKLDPHLRFQAFLKIEEGLEGAKEIYEDMFSNSKEVIDRYAIILLMNKYEKIAALESFTKEYPDFAPAWYELGIMYFKNMMQYKDRSKSVFEKSIEFYNSGKMSKYYIDKSELVEVGRIIEDFERVKDYFG